MSKVPFKVSARTARLIGRENVANANGAVVELVKNTYDADAENCIIYFDNKYHSIPHTLSSGEYSKLSTMSDIIETHYIADIEGNYTLNLNANASTIGLNTFFSNLCCIYIIDNGTGMNDSIIQNHWMTIGTDIKDKDYISPKSRVKTGAKGIGRFALDRLGKVCEMYTLPAGKTNGYLWKVDWSEFEKPNLSIDQILADLTEIPNMDLKQTIKSITNDYSLLSDLIQDLKLDSGTILKICLLNDDWDQYLVSKIFENLEILVPPKEISDFKITLLSSLEEKEYGDVSPDFCDEYDYKVSAKYLDGANKTVKITIERNELDISSIETKYMNVIEHEKMKEFPYNFETFKNKSFIIERTLSSLLPGFKDVDEKKTLDKIGDFSFTFYYLKNQVPTDEKGVYPYKSIHSSFRKEWLQKFGGIKIFRDGFRIRPYGEPGYDWLDLGNRAAKSPGSAGQTLGGYRVRPTQISGSLHISRITNVNFQDKSGREGIQENDEFKVLKELLLGIISVFENDRNHIMYYFNKVHKSTVAAKKKQAEELAKKIAEEETRKKDEDKADNTSQESNGKTEASEDKDEDVIILANGFAAQKNELDEKNEEIRISRSLSSSGLLIASFAHEFKTLHRKLSSRTASLRDLLEDTLPKTKVEHLPAFKNPYVLIDEMENQDAKLSQWLKISLLTLKKDKRKRTNIDIKEYFKELHATWNVLLSQRSILLVTPSGEESCEIKVLPIDLDSIFSNLIANSIDAFKRDGASKERIITITWEKKNDNLIIFYSDTGCGLSADYENPEVIFNAFVTTKRDKHGNIIGTGLGMWIVKNIIDDYAGKINILKPEVGFGLEIILPIRGRGE
ncbi:sensor histidine kinase [Methanolobus sp.]|uniref:sensor histidine kinase n=1 Tax=Methanolobus sp. TaxID=1874737 RepID=UPI0025D0E51F|nr:sensor histidine kinase [Methanolobus sp.]